MIYLSKKGTFSSDQSHWHSQQEHISFVYFPSTLIEEKNLPQRVPGHRALTNVYFEIFHSHIIFEHVFINKKLCFRVGCLTDTRKGTCRFVYFSLAYSKKKRTSMSGRWPSTGNLQIASPKSWWFCRHYRWQFAFHRGSTPLIWP